MREAIRGGHNPQAVGCSGLIDEVIEDRNVKNAVIKWLKVANETPLDVTPGNCDVNTDLAYGVNTANNAKVDFFASIHFNKAYDSYNGSIGTEVWLNPSNSEVVTIGKRIVNNLVSLGFKNRGLKDGVNGEHLYEIRNTNMNSMIIEICFVEATEDVRIYKSIGYDRIGKAIAEGIIGHSINLNVPTNGWYQESNVWYYNENKVKVINKWEKDSKGLWYFLGGDGAMVTNRWIHSNDGKWYYLGNDGSMQMNKWIKYQNKDFYVGADGAMLVNTKTPDGYTVTEDGSWNGKPQVK